MKQDKLLDLEFDIVDRLYQQKSCELCYKHNSGASMILCDRCEDGYHMKCLGMSSLPKGEWVCEPCTLDNLIITNFHKSI